MKNDGDRTMRTIPNRKIDSFRSFHPSLGSSKKGLNYGYFLIPCMKGTVLLTVIASDGLNATAMGWEHVSVSLPDRCPTWDEMCRVKELFWKSSETVIQFHPRKSEYKNQHPYCLHLWRKMGKEHQLPPQCQV